MKKISIFFSLLITLSSLAQTTITGKVSDLQGNSLANASVTVEIPNNSVIIAYNITDAKGYYKIVFNSSLQKINLRVKAFNKKTQIKIVDNRDQTINFNMVSDITEIKEVVLKTKLITRKGDTISYDLKSFTHKNDRVLADALKKIPGIDVNKDGTILYQGEPINKFYINGKDLMEGGYGLINNSLPIQAIGKVEVMENHQPVKILQDKIPSDQAAINIKLKKSITMTGRGELGLGASPLLWNVKLSPMLFTDKVQWVLSYKTNNQAESIESESNILSFGSRHEGVRRQVSQKNWLNIDQASSPNISQKRYLLNSVHFLSGSLLTQLKNKDWEFKAHSNYTNNTIEQDSYNETQYAQQFNHGAQISHSIKNNFYTDKAKAELIFTKNTKKTFFKNTTSLTQFWNSDRGFIDRSITNYNSSIQTTAKESLASPTTSFQNSLSSIVPWGHKLINIRSFINHQNDEQTLRVDPIRFTDQQSFDSLGHPVYQSIFPYSPSAKIAEQYVKIKNFETQNTANLSFSEKKWTFTPEISLSYIRDQLLTTLYGKGPKGIETYGNQYNNTITFNHTTPSLSTLINYKGDQLNLYLNLGVRFNHIKTMDQPGNSIINLQKSTFEPSLYAQYEFASFWKASINGNIQYTFGNIGDVYTGFILQTPSNLATTSANGVLAENRVNHSNARIAYRNPLNNLFFNLRASISKTQKNLMSNTSYNGGNITLAYVVKDNDLNTNSQQMEVGKYFPKFKTNASVSYSTRYQKSISLNNDQIQRSRNHNQNWRFKFNTTYFNWMSLDYNFSYEWGKNIYTYKGSNDAIASGNWSHQLSVILYPVKNHSLAMDWEQTNFSQGNQYLHNPFYDLTYQYVWTKKKIDFELKWLNIANTKIYQQIGNTSVGTLYKRMYIRPTQVMFSLKFNFK
ncbi:hypothetical protein GNY06_04720 [Elizabethkingia argentiflava]|uniref:Carboxypeptidase regulatory-like domain-containing protein n=1 Tax=Elizabethkingia argenteiflava TaxID=2681556 RepID=A0A845PW89_9FLAO|nr:carboxypeptidase-like regulatory domain-containing protein [Elizabethkingia argenteiflava]NAW50717.1 hypothetical protein [Elizabethkingia argenteiflava]